MPHQWVCNQRAAGSARKGGTNTMTIRTIGLNEPSEPHSGPIHGWCGPWYIEVVRKCSSCEREMLVIMWLMSIRMMMQHLM